MEYKNLANYLKGCPGRKVIYESYNFDPDRPPLGGMPVARLVLQFEARTSDDVAEIVKAIKSAEDTHNVKVNPTIEMLEDNGEHLIKVNVGMLNISSKSAVTDDKLSAKVLRYINAQLNLCHPHGF